MSTDFRSCPGCDSFILADTYECPDCGHIFDEDRAQANKASTEAGASKSQQMYNVCESCGESVRAGLVRCWKCNAFMRKDVAERYKEMTENPQPIIFSEIPLEERTEVIPPRRGTGARDFKQHIFDAEEEDEFTLSDDVAPEFELDSPTAQKSGPQKAPQAKDTNPSRNGAQAAPAEKSESPQPEKSKPDTPPKTAGEIDVDDLVGNALQEQRENRRRKREKIQESKKKRILLPCGACGAWMRVHEEQGGRTVRCSQCKARVVVPTMKKKEGKPTGSQPAAKIDVLWLQDVRLHIVSPTDVVLKPGSLSKLVETVDAGFHESGIHLVRFAVPAKKGLFSMATDGTPPVEEQRLKIREQITNAGQFSDPPFGTLHSIATDQVNNLRLIQPVAEAHASMFAGVPVFGAGQIAIYLPLQLEDNKQAFLSFPLSVFRQVDELVKSKFNHELGAAENGVPATEETDSLTCILSDQTFEAQKNTEYYEHDPAYELELCGYVCETCGAAVGEEARARKKLGGATGRGIAKAKCPKCSSKMGNKKLFKLSRRPEDDKPEEEEDVSEVLKPKKKKKPTAEKTTPEAQPASK